VKTSIVKAEKIDDYLASIIASALELRENLDSPHWDEGLFNQLRNLKDDLKVVLVWVTQSKT
jgi:hypothetical protein